MRVPLHSSTVSLDRDEQLMERAIALAPTLVLTTPAAGTRPCESSRTRNGG